MGRHHIYNPDTGQVLLAKFTSSEAMVSDNPTNTLEDYYRTKTYVKPKDMLRPDYPIFYQPYQFAQEMFGRTWNDYNDVFIIQVAGCNMNCWYCYVDQRLREGIEIDEDTGQRWGQWFTPAEVKALFDQSGKHVLRISGGEPLLAPQFVVGMMNEMAMEDDLLWFDTNLVGDSDFFSMINREIPEGAQEAIGMSGCFKGFTPKDASWISEIGGGVLDVQFRNARRFVHETSLETFFYVPGVMGKDVRERDIRNFFERMVEEVDAMAPLRTYILKVKNYSPTRSQGWETCVDHFEDTGRRPIDVWQELCEEYYPAEKVWLPNHQVRFVARGEKDA